MKRLASTLSVFLAIVGVLIFVSPASAQATRTWVSGVGDDANPCSRTAPCKTFAGAISKTSAPGEINCLDPGGFGGVTITKEITILCDAVSNGGVLVSGTPGITVAAGVSDSVVLQGLDFEGIGSGTNGVQVNSGANIYIIHCTIRDFAQNGVNVTSTTAGTRVYIRDSIIENNVGGLNVQGVAGVSNLAFLENSLVFGNTSFAVQVNGSTNAIGLIRSTLAGSSTGINALGGASVNSFGPSNVIGGTGAPTGTIPYK